MVSAMNRRGRMLVAHAVSSVALVILAGCVAHPRQPAPAPTSAPTTTQWSYRGNTGLEIRTQHWILYTAVTDPRWIDRLPKFVEAAHDHYQALVPAPATSRDLTLYIFKNGVQWEDYGRLLGIPEKEVTVVGELTGFARKDSAAVYLSQERTYTLSAVGHVGMLEYLWLHGAGDAPLWIREGLATQAEGFDEQQEESLFVPGQIRAVRYVFQPGFNARRFHQMRVAIQKNWLLGLDQLLTMEDFGKGTNPQLIAQTYLAQLWAMMVFMDGSKDYRKGYERMRQDLASGALASKVQDYLAAGTQKITPGQAAFHIYITADTAAFQRKFMDWVVQYVGLVR